MRIRDIINIARRLHFKIALFVILTIIVIFGLYSAYYFYSYQRKLTSLEAQASEELGRTLTSSLEIAMLNSDLESIQYSIEEVSKNENIVRVFLLNMESVVKASSQADLIGLHMSTQDLGCSGCHVSGTAPPSSRTISLDSEEVLRVVTPIMNKPVCFSCHGDTDRLNGVLVLDRSLLSIKTEIVSNLKLAGGVAVASVLVMMFLFRWYIKRQVINRVVYLESLARRVVGNELDLDIELNGQDELASLAGSFNDMKTSLKLSMQRIDNHRNYLTHLLENLIDGILIVDDLEQVAFVNKAFRDILHLDQSAVQAGDRMDLKEQPLDRIAPIRSLIALSQERNTAVKEVVKFQIPDEPLKHLEVHVGNLILPPWLKPEVIVVIRDITARVTFENQVYQAEKLATIGRLAAGIAHEINNPMASIMTCAEGLLKSEPAVEDGKRKYLDIIKNSARRCKIITQKLLDYSAASTMRMDIIDLDEVLQEAASLLQFEATRKQVQMSTTKPATMPVVSGCRDSLVQVFVNLILNGIQAVEPGGVVHASVEVGAKSVDVTVEDNGPGIDEENLKRVFDPFFTTKPIGVGTGLGLSVSQGIVKQHGGRMEILQSTKGSTSIMVTLPTVQDERQSHD
ncbi:MAG: ATP-binding protein [candidate division Zixibacteria bacterium]|nr:ATP-binding protein [candidate division Zixibacteria bacterium]MDH3938796.1 ATP-binding protein [candidate division Zixibacteria bacterium]MDH4035100.1 ATP-binding protein [candidate division Zixibacteria bacterium]